MRPWRKFTGFLTVKEQRESSEDGTDGNVLEATILYFYLSSAQAHNPTMIVTGSWSGLYLH